ncbi:MAG: division/cell wall cluster transcriptional repressor MraZ [Bacillota bacterium]|nr:division/cell wall cluster transcriptional repressor MraZ [Bacillota bacterium]
MLIGEVAQTIDGKGRYIVPAKFRNDLGARFVIARGVDCCLAIYPLAVWQQVVEKLAATSKADPGKRAFSRRLTSSAFEAELDAQYRVVLPPALREYAKLQKDIVTIGATNRLEIWDKDIWHDYISDDDGSDQELAAEFADILL